MQQRDGVKSTSITSRPRTRGRTTANRSCLLERLISPLAASGGWNLVFLRIPIVWTTSKCRASGGSAGVSSVYLVFFSDSTPSSKATRNRDGLHPPCRAAQLIYHSFKEKSVISIISRRV